jgi:hypothetical protein
MPDAIPIPIRRATITHGPAIGGCDGEPIHVPGSIQPHGILLVARASDLEVVSGAGDIELMLAPFWLGRTVPDLFGRRVDLLLKAKPQSITVPLGQVRTSIATLDATAHRSGDLIMVELEVAPDADPGVASFGRINPSDCPWSVRAHRPILRRGRCSTGLSHRPAVVLQRQGLSRFHFLAWRVAFLDGVHVLPHSSG